MCGDCLDNNRFFTLWGDRAGRNHWRNGTSIFIFTMLLNPAFLWRRLISYVLLGWAGLFVMDWTIAAKMKNGSEETEVSLVSSGLDLDWTILTPIAIVSVVLIGIFAVFEHKRMEG